MVFDNFFSFIENFGFYILSLVFTFKVFRMKSFRVSEGVACFSQYFIHLRVIPTSPSVIVQGSEQGIFW